MSRPAQNASGRSAGAAGSRSPPPRLHNTGTLFQVFKEPIFSTSSSVSPQASSGTKDARRTRHIARKSKPDSTPPTSLSELLYASSDDSHQSLPVPRNSGGSSRGNSSTPTHVSSATTSPTAVSSMGRDHVVECNNGLVHNKDFWSVVGSSSKRCSSAKNKSKYVCGICGAEFTQSGSRNTHMRTVHEHQRKYSCEETGCGRAFGHRGDLTRHIQEVHVKARLFTCNICGRHFSRKYALSRHVRAKHP